MIDSPHHRLTEGLLMNLSVCILSGCHPLTPCTTNHTFGTLAFVVTRGNEVSEWFLNQSALALPKIRGVDQYL